MSDKKIDFSELKTIPNILTLIRIVLIGPFVVKFLQQDYIAAVIIIVISGLTDCFDGIIARKFDMITELGKLLDPLADKMTLMAVAACLCTVFPVIIPLMIILTVKDLLMLVGASVLIKKGIKPPAAKWYGKIGTLLFYVSVAVLIFAKAVFNYENDILTITLMAATAIAMLFALVKYFQLFIDLKTVDKQAKAIENKQNIKKLKTEK